MQLNDSDIGEFADLWRKEFDEGLTPEDARIAASQLLTLYTLLAESKDEFCA